MENSFTLFEIILSVIISAIVIINSAFFSKELFQTNKDMQNIEIAKLDLLSTKIFLQKNSKYLEESLKLEEKILYFGKNILLQNVDTFTILKKANYYEISIEINNRVKEEWNIKL